jgi:hypothetical protein
MFKSDTSASVFLNLDRAKIVAHKAWRDVTLAPCKPGLNHCTM